jgi:chromosomal replication initiator protein
VLIGEREGTAALEQAVVRRVGEPRYKLWFERHTRFTWDETALTVGVPNRHFEEWLQKTFGAAVAEAAREVFGRPLAVRFVIDPQLFQAARREQAEAVGAVRPAAMTPAAVAEAEEPEETPEPVARRARRWRKLHEFVVGPGNRVAYAAAVSIVEVPGDGVNPLVLHGPVGVGKTHLLEGVYAGLRRGRPGWNVTYLTSEEFTNRFVQAMRGGKLAGFRKQFRACDALLLDDLHFLASKKATQEEFLHTFDALQAEGRQLVVTCDCHPRLADDFTPELTDRLLGGAVWALAPPDAATRLAILQARALQDGGMPVGDEVLRFLAAQLRGNVRELEGALNGLRHFCRVTGRPADLAAAREALVDLLRHAVRVVLLTDVEKAVCSALRLEAGALRAKGRAWAVSHPRLVAMHLARKHTASSYSEIAIHFGVRNHSSAVAAEKKVRQWLADDANLSFGEQRVRVRDVVERVERDLLR